MKFNKKGFLIAILGLFIGGCNEPVTDDPSPEEPKPPFDEKEPIINQPKVEICNNGIDDDGNGLIDCKDPACHEETYCQSVSAEDCHNGIDDDKNGLTDCKDPACLKDAQCIIENTPPVEAEEICDNGIDDDKNGLIDCKDPNCYSFAGCKTVVENCTNKIDDDKNGLIDCADPACINSSACRTPDGDPIEREVDGTWVLPLTRKPYTTLNRALRPHIGNKNYSEDDVNELIRNRDLHVYQYDKFERYGLGAELVGGEPWNEYNDLVKGSAPTHTAKAKSLAWIWQISDPQLVDEESPCRMEGVTIWPYSIASAYRPQDHLSIHMMDVHIQTGMRISEISHRPFDFILVTGDISDNAQFNEQMWFQSMMGGGITNPDSGKDDDPVPGLNNDFADPFYSPGVGKIPWYPAIGNHDLLYMGFSSPNEEIQQVCTGDHTENLFQYLSDALPIISGHDMRKGWSNGFRDASKPDAPIITDTKVKTPADPDRRLLTKTETLQLYYDAPGMPVGHGLDKETLNKGWGYYSTYPMPDKPIRLITLDLNSGGFSEGMMYEEQFQWLSGQLKDAESKKEIVILQSHHDTGSFGGEVTQERFNKLVASYRNVVLHITGHGHNNKTTLYKAPSFNTSSQGYWEVMLASSIDFPSQTRVFEFVWEPGTTNISIYITNIDANAPKGSLVYDAIRMAAARLFFSTKNLGDSDPRKFWDDEKPARNMIINTTIPQDIADNLAKYEWPDVVESTSTLTSITYNDNR